MRTVTVRRFISEKPRVIDQLLDPPTIIEFEGSFEVFDIRQTNDEWWLEVGSTGLRMTLRFESLSHGYYYSQESGENQPLELMETELTYRPLNEGTEIVASSSVSMGMHPKIITDRIAAWKRKGELRRALVEIDHKVG